MTRRGHPVAAVFLALSIVLTGVVAGLFERWIQTAQLPSLSPAASVEVLASDGRLLRPFPVEDGRWRLWISGPQSADPLYLKMLISYEDKRFFTHPGVDVRALARAAVQAVAQRRIVSGGSTLTMQVARLLEDSGTGSISGKLRQIRLALALERRLTKEEILSLYLVLAPMGGNLEGLRAGSLAWLGKEPGRLTPAEAALLVALPQSPSLRRPDTSPEAARISRDRVLTQMARRGVLSSEDVVAARSEPMPDRRRLFPAHAPHLTDRLRHASPAQREIRTSLDYDLQLRAEALMRHVAEQVGQHRTAALIVADHETGAILAHVGNARSGLEPGSGWLDMTQAVRSPGSTLKPLVYALAFDAGIAHPESIIADRPQDFGGYSPTNFDGAFRGEIRVRDALAQSLNVPAVALTEVIGPARLFAGMRRGGMSPVLPGGQPGLALALGGVGVTLTDLVVLHAGIARGGTALSAISATGEQRDGARLVSAPAAWHVTHILAGLAPPDGAPRLGIAYKTGTSYGYRDAWAVGWDGRHVVGVWVGRPDGTPVPGALGGDVAAPILFQAFGLLGEVTPHRSPPAETILGATASLPPHLRRIGPVADADAAPRLLFPPDGAEVFVDDGLWLKVGRGRPPFTWLANGAPVVIGARARETVIETPGIGHLNLSVIDADGRSARVSIVVR